MSFDKRRVDRWNWRSLSNGHAGQLGYYKPLEWLAKKTANHIHEFYNDHFPSFSAFAFPRLPLDRRNRNNIHGQLPSRTIATLLESLVYHHGPGNPGHYTMFKCLKLGHQNFPGKQLIRAQPFSVDKLLG